jgi:predicted DNA-binding transcriptional regulator YafY
MVSEGELLSFFLSVELARRYLGTTFEAPLRSAVLKLAASLPTSVQVDLDQLADNYSFGTGATATVDPYLLMALDRAFRDHRPCDVTYFTPSRNALTERTLHPYRLHNVRGDWQLIAFDSYRGRVLTFAVERIRRWTVRHGERFDWLEGFSLDAYLASQFISERVDEPITFVIWFDPYQAHYIRERHWHATQEPLTEHKDGSVTMHITAGTPGEIKRWVLGFGAHARIVEPRSLADDVQAELRAALKTYENA